MTSDPDREPGRRSLLVVEAVLSTLAVGLVLFLPLHHLASYFCIFGGCPEPGAEEIRIYRSTVGALAVAAGGTLALAGRRRSGRALAWHCLVAAAGVGAALLFTVPAVDWREVLRDDPDPKDGNHVACHSGAPDDCPGG